MAVTISLPFGVPTAITQTTAYAVPVDRLIRMTCDDTTATFQVSNDPAFGSPTSATLSGTGFDGAYAFVRCTNKNATINVRRWL